MLKNFENAIWKAARVEAFRNIYICMYKRILNRITLQQRENSSHRCHRLANKKSSTSYELPLFESVSEVPENPLEHYKTLPPPLVTIQNLTVNVVAEDTAHLSHRTWSSQDGTDMEASFLLASFHGVRGSISSIR